MIENLAVKVFHRCPKILSQRKRVKEANQKKIKSNKASQRILYPKLNLKIMKKCKKKLLKKITKSRLIKLRVRKLLKPLKLITKKLTQRRQLSSRILLTMTLPHKLRMKLPTLSLKTIMRNRQ